MFGLSKNSRLMKVGAIYAIISNLSEVFCVGVARTSLRVRERQSYFDRAQYKSVTTAGIVSRNSLKYMLKLWCCT
ncbi:hypothetical protein [Nostoc sp.]|uniref:hypothetical protein n=1 Tax=Nostoc sp. TaxID=1180 RepID=UPI002FFA36F6